MDSNETFKLDLQILQDGAISMYHDMDILDNDLSQLKQLDYTVFDIDTTNWTPETAHKYIKDKLDFPDYYGENLAAFNDCLSDMYSTDSKGQVIVFRHFDKFAKKDKDFCEGLLDVIANQSRQWLLTGQRLIGIVQSDDPDLYFNKVGGYNPTWNRQEWFDAHRKKK